MEKYGRSEFNLVYTIMDRFRSTRFMLESQTKIASQVRSDLPKVSSKKLSEVEVSELIGLVSSKMILEDFTMNTQ